MAYGRFISVSVAEDDRLNSLSMVAELIYLKTIPHLDRDGMISGKPGLLYSKVCPLREELFGQTQHIIDEWTEIGLVIRFMSDAGPVLFFPGFAKNNKLHHYDRERPSRFPCPPGYVRGEKGLLLESDAESEPAGQDTPVDPSNNSLLESVQDEVQDSVQDEILELVPFFGTEEQEQEEDQDQDQDQGGGNTRVCRAHATPPPSCCARKKLVPRRSEGAERPPCPAAQRGNGAHRRIAQPDAGNVCVLTGRRVDGHGAKGIGRRRSGLPDGV